MADPHLPAFDREFDRQWALAVLDRAITTLAAQDFPAWLAADANRIRGEFALVLHPAAASVASGPDTRVLKLLLAELPLKSAVKLAAEITGEPRNALYDMALALKNA